MKCKKCGHEFGKEEADKKQEVAGEVSIMNPETESYPISACPECGSIEVVK